MGFLVEKAIGQEETFQHPITILPVSLANSGSSFTLQKTKLLFAYKITEYFPLSKSYIVLPNTRSICHGMALFHMEEPKYTFVIR